MVLFSTKHSEHSFSLSIKHLLAFDLLSPSLSEEKSPATRFLATSREKHLNNLSQIFSKGSGTIVPRILWFSSATPTVDSVSIRVDVLSRNHYNWPILCPPVAVLGPDRWDSTKLDAGPGSRRKEPAKCPTKSLEPLRSTTLHHSVIYSKSWWARHEPF